MLYLEPYDYDIFYIKQDPVAAHYSSKYYIPRSKLKSHSNTTEQYVKTITENAIPQTVTINKIHHTLKSDDILEEIIININQIIGQDKKRVLHLTSNYNMT